VTPSVSSKGRRYASDAGKGVVESRGPVCTSVCTSNAENTHADPLDKLAAVLLALSPADRARLTAMLGQGGSEANARKGGE
jgi:hypothetical protein